MPSDFLANAKPVKPEDDFLSNAQPVAQTQGKMSAGQPESWLNQLEGDLTYGGNRTLPGRVLGYMQGRGGKGYSGMGEGPMGVKSDLASMPMGVLHALQGEQQMITGPNRGQGFVNMLKGELEASRLPMMFAGGPEADEVIERLPSAADVFPTRKAAGRLLDQVGTAVGKRPVVFTRTTPALENAQRLSAWGHGNVTPLDNLYQRMQTINPIDYEEARGRYSPLTRLTASDRMRATPQLQGAARKVAQEMKEDIGDTAESVGMRPQYETGMRRYARASRNREVFAKAGKAGLKYGVPGAVGYEVGRPILHAFTGK